MIKGRMSILIPGILLISLGIFEFYMLYEMVVLEAFYTTALTVLVSATGIFSLLSGIGLILKRKWSFEAYIGLSILILATLIHVTDFTVQSKEDLFIKSFSITLFVLVLLGVYIRRQLQVKH